MFGIQSRITNNIIVDADCTFAIVRPQKFIIIFAIVTNNIFYDCYFLSYFFDKYASAQILVGIFVICVVIQ